MKKPPALWNEQRENGADFRRSTEHDVKRLFLSFGKAQEGDGDREKRQRVAERAERGKTKSHDEKNKNASNR